MAKSRLRNQQRTRRKTSKHRTSNLDVGVEVSRDYPWKLLGRLTTDLTEWLPDVDRQEVIGIVRSRNFDRYLSLGERWGLQSINSTHEAPTPGMAAKLLLSAVIKKYPFEGNDTEKRDVALTKVRATNQTCSCFNRQGWKRLFTDGHPSPELFYMREFISKVIGFSLPDGSQITEWSRHGPGSDTATLLGNNSTYVKYKDWPYRVSARCQEYARNLILADERWLGALEDSYRRKYHINMWEILDWNTFWDTVFVTTEANKVTTVPKDGRQDRPIAIEPRLNLMLQLGVDGFIRKRLKRWGIDMDSQVVNQYLAYEGSIRKDADSPVTIDLSNASDTISLRLVKLLFPQEWYDYLCATRCRFGLMPDGSKLRYSKLSSMGNGYTFAVETLIFSATCYAAMKVSGIKWSHDNVSVFGDDIIVPQSASSALINLLQACGLEVNETKSFLDGNVRESCGSDWVSGVNMRPVFVKTIPETVCDLYTVRNLILRWGKLHIASAMLESTSYIESLIPKAFKLYGPYSDEEFSSYLHSSIARGWASDKHPNGGLCLWSYHFEYIACQPKSFGGNEFLFRKLMHTLRPTGIVENHWLKRKFESGGSRFAITKRDRVAYHKRIRNLPEWKSVYCDAFDWPSAGVMPA